MKIKVLIMLALMNVIILSACSLGRSRIAMINREDEGKTADARFEQLIEIIKNRDKETLKSMFSKQALNEAEDIDGHIEYLLGFIKGEIISWENETWGSDDSIRNGKTIMTEIKSWYKVTTDQNEYLFFLLDYSKDNENPDNVGLYALRVINAEDKETKYGYWQDMKIAGIYKPEE